MILDPNSRRTSITDCSMDCSEIRHAYHRRATKMLVSHKDVACLGFAHNRLFHLTSQANGAAEGRTQFYQSAPQKLRNAVSHFNSDAGLACVLSLGDAIDGNTTLQQTMDELETVALEFDKCSTPVWHVVGNHCLAAGTILAANGHHSIYRPCHCCHLEQHEKGLRHPCVRLGSQNGLRPYCPL
jgi:hypothetical protein